MKRFPTSNPSFVQTCIYAVSQVKSQPTNPVNTTWLFRHHCDKPMNQGSLKTHFFVGHMCQTPLISAPTSCGHVCQGNCPMDPETLAGTPQMLKILDSFQSLYHKTHRRITNIRHKRKSSDKWKYTHVEKALVGASLHSIDHDICNCPNTVADNVVIRLININTLCIQAAENSSATSSRSCSNPLIVGSGYAPTPQIHTLPRHLTMADPQLPFTHSTACSCSCFDNHHTSHSCWLLLHDNLNYTAHEYVSMTPQHSCPSPIPLHRVSPPDTLLTNILSSLGGGIMLKSSTHQLINPLLIKCDGLVTCSEVTL